MHDPLLAASKLASARLRDDFLNDLERFAGAAIASSESPVAAKVRFKLAAILRITLLKQFYSLIDAAKFQTQTGVEMKEFEDWGDKKEAAALPKSPLKHFEKEELEENKEMTPTKKAALEAAKASTIAHQLEEQLKNTGYKVSRLLFF